MYRSPTDSAHPNADTARLFLLRALSPSEQMDSMHLHVRGSKEVRKARGCKAVSRQQPSSPKRVPTCGTPRLLDREARHSIPSHRSKQHLKTVGLL